VEWPVILALVIAIPLILFPVAFLWYLNMGGIYAAIREARKRKAARGREAGEVRQVAVIGRRVTSGILSRPVRIVAGIATPVVVYGVIIWLALAGLGWAAALAVGLAIPIVLIPVAFLWYMNVSGLYRVMRATRQRQKRRAEVRAEAVKEAEEIVRGRTMVGMAGEELVGHQRKGLLDEAETKGGTL
jgi:hypothetical protein